MKFPVIVASAAFACKVFAAEQRLEVKDLPRVPPTEPTNAASTIQLREGFRAELAASEPLIADPVAMCFDENGRLYVVEMGDYSERRNEKLGRVKLLEDTNHDGRFDKATLFADKLAWPTAIICSDGGVFVGASPDILFLKDSNGDGVADRRNLAFTGFGNGASRLNVQQLLNSFTWGIDNRIHGALGGNPSIVTNMALRDTRPLELRGRDFSFDPRNFDLAPESGGGQWGIAFDNEGNKFTCSNARHIAVEMYENRYASRNRFHSLPPPDVNVGPDAPAAEIFRISPEEPWRVLRTQWRVAGLVPGPVEGGGRASGYFSGASGITLYRGDAFPAEFHGNAFIADCGSNLIHRKRLRREGLNYIAERAADEKSREFLASRDNWFRPVSMANAPDGTLYVLDMYRETVEHPWSLPPELKSKLDLNSGNDRGRIFRIVPDGFKQPAPVRLGQATTAELVQTLAHANGWHRDTAARLLCERRDASAADLLRNLAHSATSHLARVHALHTLRSLGGLTLNRLRDAARDSNAVVRTHAVRLAADLGHIRDNAFQSLANDPEIRVRFQLALAATDSVTLTKLIERDVDEPWMRAAVLSGLDAAAAEVFAALARDKDFNARAGATEFLRECARIAGASAPWNRVALGLHVSAGSPRAMTYAAAVISGLEQRRTSLAAVDRKSFDQLNERARALLRDSRAEEAERIASAEVLGRAGDSQANASLSALLAPDVSAPLQSAAVTVLARRGNAGFTNVLARWPQLSPLARTRAVTLALSRRDMTGALLNAVESATVARTELTASDVQRLTSHTDQSLRTRAAKLFSRENSSRAETVKQFGPALALFGDATRGHVIYQQRCATCHRAGNEGFAVGPDLASVATAGAEKLLTSIVDPNAEVASAFVAYTVETKGGDSHVGVLASDSSQAVTLKLPNGESARLNRDEILSMRGSDKSLMPEGLEEGLSHQEMADLLAFISKRP